ncbi:unnamed protein product [Caenorhabditis sp. 36 PRJEB53466]|nr:unnamed protein product [Caenorhabditis sp. 36 PRJEB53466]
MADKMEIPAMMDAITAELLDMIRPAIQLIAKPREEEKPPVLSQRGLQVHADFNALRDRNNELVLLDKNPAAFRMVEKLKAFREVTGDSPETTDSMFMLAYLLNDDKVQKEHPPREKRFFRKAGFSHGQGEIRNNYGSKSGPPKKKMHRNYRHDDDDEHWFIWTDGACPNNGRPNAVAGWAIFFGDGDRRNRNGGVIGVQTNNIAELVGVKMAILTARRSQVYRVTIFTDSRYVVDSLNNFINLWRINGYINSNGQPVANRELIQEIEELRDSMDEVNIVHVPAHCGNYNNERADEMARDAADSRRRYLFSFH